MKEKEGEMSASQAIHKIFLPGLMIMLVMLGCDQSTAPTTASQSLTPLSTQLATQTGIQSQTTAFSQSPTPGAASPTASSV